MASNHASLDAAATERRVRLAKLASLKRKQPPTENGEAVTQSSNTTSIDAEADVTKHLSGRNYDPETRGPRLGFENAPNENQETLEARAENLAKDAREKEEREKKEDKPLDLFTLQPKKPNWDLKRDLARKMEVLGQRTDNAIAKMVRERIEGEKKKEKENMNGNGAAGGGGESVGIGGVDLVEGVRVREREEEEDEIREKEEEQEAF
ncbi:MAG: hypothetical protein Q9164_005611 [Protoblastenia rupestris]